MPSRCSRPASRLEARLASPGRDGHLPPNPEGTWTPALWGCVGLLPPAVARLWTLCRPGEAPPSPGPGLQGCSSVPLRPRAISAGRGKRTVASPCPPPHHNGPEPPTAWAAEQPQACPPEAGQELRPSRSPAGRASPQREAWGLRSGGPGGLGCCTHCPPLPSPASGGTAPPPTWQQGFWEHRGAGGGHRHSQGHGVGAPRLVNSSVGRSHRRPVPARAASDAGPPHGSRARPGGTRSSSWTSGGADHGFHEGLGCTRVCAGVCACGTCGRLCVCECTRVHACCVGALCVCMGVCVYPFTLSKEVFL